MYRLTRGQRVLRHPHPNRGATHEGAWQDLAHASRWYCRAIRLACDSTLQVLGKRHALHVSSLTDGVVAFEDASDADAYARMLKEEGVAQQVRLPRVNHHGW